MTPQPDLVTFFAARLDEEEAEAKGPPGWKLEHWTAIRYADKDSGRNWRVDAEPRCVVDQVAQEDAVFIARHDPARALREVAAKRAILAEHEPEPWGDPHPELLRCAQGHGDEYWTTWPCTEVRALTAVWSDCPGYRQEWA
jgi:hypothetical protein